MRISSDFKFVLFVMLSSLRPLMFCKLSLMEKYLTLYALADERCLKKRNVFVAKCRNQNKLLLIYSNDSNDFCIFISIFVFSF